MTLAVAEAWAEGYKPPDERAIAMARLYVEEGLTLQAIGDRYGLTRQRVDQILKPFGLEPHWGKQRLATRRHELVAAHDRIHAGRSTSKKEAERLGYASDKNFREAVNAIGLDLRRQWKEAKHGTVLRYRQGCKCKRCLRAHREDLYDTRAKHVITEHGLATNYVNYGCRCPECREAVRIQRRELVARKRQALTTD